MEITQDDIRVQRPTNYAWLRIPNELEKMTEVHTKGELQQLDLTAPYMEELLRIGVMEQSFSPSKPPRKKIQGHEIDIHTEIAIQDNEERTPGKESAQGRFSESLNFEE